MTFEQRKQERQALVQHLLAQDWNVFGTLKFVNGRTIGRSIALTNSCAATGTSMDRMIFGKAAERQNMRVPRWCFAHEGSDSENFHVHFVMKSATPRHRTHVLFAQRSVGAAPCSNSATG